MIRNIMAKKKRSKLAFVEPSKGPGDYVDWLRWREVNNGILRIDNDIETEMTKVIMMELSEIRRRGHRNVVVHINSCGGSVDDALAIYDSIKLTSEMGAEVVIMCEGFVASAAAQIVLQAGDCRASLPSTRFCIHEIYRWGGIIETVSQLDDSTNDIKKTYQKVLDIMANRCGHTASYIQKFIGRRDVYMNADEALDWGLIDVVLYEQTKDNG